MVQQSQLPLRYSRGNAGCRDGDLDEAYLPVRSLCSGPADGDVAASSNSLHP
jgi:hypothetical protein